MLKFVRKSDSDNNNNNVVPLFSLKASDDEVMLPEEDDSVRGTCLFLRLDIRFFLYKQFVFWAVPRKLFNNLFNFLLPGLHLP